MSDQEDDTDRKPAAKKKPQALIGDDFDVVVPPSLLNNGECTVIVQIDPEDSTALEFAGATGAVGRMETDDQGSTVYRGTLYPSSTAMVLSVVNKKDETPYIKIDGIADEFCRLVKTGSAMDKMQAEIKGDIGDYRILDEDVNRIVKEASSENAVATGKRKGKADVATAVTTAKKRKTKGKK